MVKEAVHGQGEVSPRRGTAEKPSLRPEAAPYLPPSGPNAQVKLGQSLTSGRMD